MAWASSGKSALLNRTLSAFWSTRRSQPFLLPQVETKATNVSHLNSCVVEIWMEYASENIVSHHHLLHTKLLITV